MPYVRSRNRSIYIFTLIKLEASANRHFFRERLKPTVVYGEGGPCCIQEEVIFYFIEINLAAGKDIFLIAKAAGYDVKTRMKHYERIDPRNRSREMTEFQYGAMPMTQRRSAL